MAVIKPTDADCTERQLERSSFQEHKTCRVWQPISNHPVA